MLEPITCRCCGQTIHPRDNAGTGDLPLCLTCLEDSSPTTRPATCPQAMTRMSPTVRTAT